MNFTLPHTICVFGCVALLYAAHGFGVATGVFIAWWSNEGQNHWRNQCQKEENCEQAASARRGIGDGDGSA